ncbi:MAG TPA: hypothetical protein VF741_06125 [Candidatus Aquilonibacter sp.]
MSVRSIAYAVIAAFLFVPIPSRAASPFGMLSYRGIGPAIAGGRMPAAAGSDLDARIYYAGGAGGGVFKSMDGGASWVPIFDGEPVAPIGAIAVSPRDPNDVWVGTGESNPRNTVEEGNGIYHSTDGGKTWTHVGLADSASISAISIDPRNTKTVVVAVLGRIFADSTARGIYVTRDGGRTWQHTLYIGPGTGASDLSRAPDRPSTLFAGMYEFRRKPWTMISGGPNSGIYRSDDGGMTWRHLTGNGLPTGLLGRIGVGTGKGGRVYADMQSREGELWRSDDFGVHWKLMPHNALVGARPFYFSRIYVDPADPDRAITVGLQLGMTADGGKTWKHIAQDAGWDYHIVWWSHDGKRVIVGCDEGVLLSVDGAQTIWQPYDLPVAQPYRLGFNNDLPNYGICFGLQDDNTWCGRVATDNGIGVLNRDWYQVGPGDGMWANFDPKDANLVWSTTTASDTGQVYLTNLHDNQQLEVSPDAEQNGTLNAAAVKYRFNWITPIAFDAAGCALVGGNAVFKSCDHGQTWSVISGDLTRNDKAHQAVAGGPISADQSGAEYYNTLLDVAPAVSDPKQIWASSDDGLVHLTGDAGATWTNVTPSGLPEGRIPTIEPGHFAAGTAYFAMDRHMSGDNAPYIYRTDDFGATWTKISANLPGDVFVRSIREDPTDANLLYAGTSRGVFVSFNRGAGWESLRLNMPASPIYDIEIQPQAGDLLVVAHGRGIWVLDDLTPLRQLAAARANALTLFPLRAAYKMATNAPVNTFTKPPLPINEFIGPNPPYGALINYYLQQPAKGVTIDVLDANGHVVRHLTGDDAPGKAGIDRTSWDLHENGPVKWHGTFSDNQGPDEGTDVVPGTYTIRVSANGHSSEQSVVVKADPRDQGTPEQARARYAYLRELFDELSGVDTMLNTIDAQLKHATPARRAELLAFQARLTYNPQNVEDLRGPAQIREHLGDLIGRVSGTSFQGPTQPDLDYAAQLSAEYQELTADGKTILQR